ncbi:ribonuclease D [Rhizobium sp. 9140]|nr:ribonuclease D [Rhizobium sp. 9140]
MAHAPPSPIIWPLSERYRIEGGSALYRLRCPPVEGNTLVTALTVDMAGSLPIGQDDDVGNFMPNTIRFHEGDIAAKDAARYNGAIAVDTETLGLVPRRDRLCLVQLSPGDGTADIVQIAAGQTSAPNLVRMLADPARQKIFHYGRFDIAVLFHTFGVTTTPVFCTKIASRLSRTYTDRHGLKDNLKEMLEIDISKQQQSSDWAAPILTPAQLDYAASDVLHLHALRDTLNQRLIRDGRIDHAEACFAFLPTRAKLDLLGWNDTDIFAHS